ncbi:GNAT family N-acetyltransferase [Lacrimispora sp.]|uniref:GNAT family N-acetyltransferase n=1 Tax=Lacrimispora sp. TaxID=2719234 RepID=UPI0028ABD648|nr:GNAT family N-acetyltransferase [Lacrimispora sp.]
MIMVTTDRMLIFPISNKEMEMKVREETDEEMKQAYSEMLAGCREKPDQRIWYAIWIMQLKNSKQIVGDLCFKGLNDNGSVEIGYGIKKEYEGKGLMTEAVTAMAKWASNQTGVSYVEAETDPNNVASQRVLQKAGFLVNGEIGEEGPRFTWKNDKN